MLLRMASRPFSHQQGGRSLRRREIRVSFSPVRGIGSDGGRGALQGFFAIGFDVGALEQINGATKGSLAPRSRAQSDSEFRFRSPVRVSPVCFADSFFGAADDRNPELGTLTRIAYPVGERR